MLGDSLIKGQLSSIVSRIECSICYIAPLMLRGGILKQFENILAEWQGTKDNGQVIKLTDCE